MHDAAGMGRVEGVSELDSEIHELGDREGMPFDPMLERLSLEQLHDDEVLPFFRGSADVVDRADVRMVQRRGRTRFALEPIHGLRIVGKFRRQKFQREVPSEARVFGAVDNTHAAATELLHDAIVRERLADHDVSLGSANGQVN
jgi:hypothetical protein